MAIAHGGDVFSAADALGRNWREVLDFSASINPLGPAPGVRQAVCGAFERLLHYPRPYAAELVERLSAAWGVPPACILAGNGATELLHFLARVAAPAAVTLAVPVFSEFHRAYPHAATVPVTDPAAWPHDGWLILTNPVNPTGRLLRREILLRHILQSSQAVVVDESFLEFTEEQSLAPLAVARDDLFVLKSLTKFYALPGARVGALVASASTLAGLRPHREPWQVNSLAEAAAIASLADQDYAIETRRFVAAEREWLRSQLAAIPGTTVLPSAANYLAVRTDVPAAHLTERLRGFGILVRNCFNWPGIEGELMRVAVRTRPENQVLLERWSEVLCER
jgi:threonine-phosphate decarboxylase